MMAPIPRSQTPVVLTLRKVEGEWKLESIGAQFGASLESG